MDYMDYMIKYSNKVFYFIYKLISNLKVDFFNK